MVVRVGPDGDGGGGCALVSVLEENQESAVFNMTACNADGGLDENLWIVTAIFL